MATEEECFCCQELAELNQKFDESGLFFLLGCFFSLDVYTKNTEKDIAVKRILFVFVRQELDVLRSTQNSGLFALILTC